LKSEVFPND